MKLAKYFLLISVTVWLSAASCSNSRNPCAFNINPEVSCRLCDKSADGTELIEYFNADTNDLRLFVISSKQEIEVVHPVGKVSNFRNKIDSNQIVFDPSDSQYLIVNGERFFIVKK